MTFVLATPLGSKAFGKSTGAASVGVWAAGGAASFGKREPVLYDAVRMGACGGALVEAHSRQVHALPNFSFQRIAYGAR